MGDPQKHKVSMQKCGKTTWILWVVPQLEPRPGCGGSFQGLSSKATEYVPVSDFKPEGARAQDGLVVGGWSNHGLTWFKHGEAPNWGGSMGYIINIHQSYLTWECQHSVFRGKQLVDFRASPGQ